MEARSINRKTFQLTENGQLLGELVYKNLFFLSGKIKLSNSDVFEIKRVGIFGARFKVTKNGTEIANLKMNWKGQIVFSFQDRQEFVLKAKGLFLHNKYILENKEEEQLIQFDPKFNWSKFDYNYNITYENKPQNILLVLIGVYASNYFIASMSGAMSGMA